MQRNPYLILGIPFGTNRDDARRQFALAARRLRRNPDGPYSTEDLTWALHEVESLEADPDNLVDYFRVPADPLAFSTEDGGIFQPSSMPMPRRTMPKNPDALNIIRSRSVVEVLDTLIRTFSADADIDLAYEPPQGDE